MRGRGRSSRFHLRAADRLHGDVRGARRSAWEEVYALVRRIPPGRVMTYGQVARLLHDRLSPRAVGWALHGCPHDVPWQRVVNRRGGISTDRLPDIPPGLQRALLEGEGVAFRADGTLDLSRHQWVPPSARGGRRPPRRQPLRLTSSRSSQKER